MDATSLVGQLVQDLEPGSIVTRFVVVAEVIDADGIRGLWTDTHDGATRWDTLGLLTFALGQEKAAQVAERFCEEDDE